MSYLNVRKLVLNDDFFTNSSVKKKQQLWITFTSIVLNPISTQSSLTKESQLAKKANPQK